MILQQKIQHSYNGFGLSNANLYLLKAQSERHLAGLIQRHKRSELLTIRLIHFHMIETEMTSLFFTSRAFRPLRWIKSSELRIYFEATSCFLNQPVIGERIPGTAC